MLERSTAIPLSSKALSQNESTKSERQHSKKRLVGTQVESSSNYIEIEGNDHAENVPFRGLDAQNSVLETLNHSVNDSYVICKKDPESYLKYELSTPRGGKTQNSDPCEEAEIYSKLSSHKRSTNIA